MEKPQSMILQRSNPTSKFIMIGVLNFCFCLIINDFNQSAVYLELHEYLLLANIILYVLYDGSMAVYNLHKISHCIVRSQSSAGGLKNNQYAKEHYTNPLDKNKNIQNLKMMTDDIYSNERNSVTLYCVL